MANTIHLTGCMPENWEKALYELTEELGFTVAEADIHIKGRHMGNEGEKVFVDGEEIGRVMKIVYSYVNEINNGLIICKKGVLKAGDHVSLHGHDAVICGTTFLS